VERITYGKIATRYLTSWLFLQQAEY